MELQGKEVRAISQIQSSPTFYDFFRERMLLIKACAGKEVFLKKLREIGIDSRITFHRLAAGRRKFPKAKMTGLATALDLTFSEQSEALKRLHGAPPRQEAESALLAGSEAVLSDPVHTIVLNVCGLSRRLKIDDVVKTVGSIAGHNEVNDSIKLLLDEGLLKQDSEGYLRRSIQNGQLSAPPGVKLDYARKYIEASLQLASQNYDLDLNQREYTAFTARIRKDDFLKLKDLVRGFRKSVYKMGEETETDSVVHVNLNAFLIQPSDSA